MRVKDRVAIVTGAGHPGGIGAAYARALAAEGAAVVLADVDPRGAEVAESLAGAGHDARFVSADISSEDSVAALSQTVMDAFGRIDILVNNAALFGGQASFPPLLETPVDTWNSMLAVNLTGTWHCCRAIVPHMKARGQGVVVNQASDAGFRVSNAYGLSKIGVLGLTTGLARELAPFNIRVNAISPGPTITGATHGFDPSLQDAVRAGIAALPLQRGGTPEDMTGALLWLVSDESSWVTGQVVRIDGGQVMDL